jgi:hypothetical protein
VTPRQALEEIERADRGDQHHMALAVLQRLVERDEHWQAAVTKLERELA